VPHIACRWRHFETHSTFWLLLHFETLTTLGACLAPP